MATNYRQPGDSVGIIAPANLKSGDPVLVGALFGIAHTDAALGQEVEIGVVGVWDLPKATGGGTGVIAGAVVYFDAVAGKCTGVAPTNMPVGLALAAAGDSATSVRVRLFGGIGGAVLDAAVAAALADHETRLGTAEGMLTDHEGRITALEGA